MSKTVSIDQFRDPQQPDSPAATRPQAENTPVVSGSVFVNTRPGATQPQYDGHEVTLTCPDCQHVNTLQVSVWEKEGASGRRWLNIRARLWKPKPKH